MDLLNSIKRLLARYSDEALFRQLQSAKNFKDEKLASNVIALMLFEIIRREADRKSASLYLKKCFPLIAQLCKQYGMDIKTPTV